MTVGPPAAPGTAGFTADWLGQRVVFGAGALEKLSVEPARLGAQRVLFIAGRGGEVADRAEALLGERLAARWDDVQQHVPGELAVAIATEARRVRADCVVSLGGGSATGLAKICALDTRLPVLAIPTTYAGSEMTPVWGRTDGSVKRTGRDLLVLPKTVLYDPTLLAALPPVLAAASGLNALAHCVEALYAPAADPLTSLAALEGARLIARWLPVVCALPGSAPGAAGRPMPGVAADPSGAAAGLAESGSASAAADAEPVRTLLWASCLAGRAFGTVGGSLHHSLCHLLGGFAGLPHAQTHAVVLPQVVAFLAAGIEPELDRLGAAFACQPGEVAGAIWDLAAATGTPSGLRALGLDADSLPAIASALADRQPPSPRPLSREDALALVTAAWRGERPSAGPLPARSAPASHARADSASADTARADTARADTARADTARADTARADTARRAGAAQAAETTQPRAAETTQSNVTEAAQLRATAAGNGQPMSASELTNAVVARLQATPDPRLREVMISLIRHLHGFVADVRLTRDEWLAAVRFLTETGQISDDRRQEFILLSDTLGVSMLVDLLAGPSGEGTAGFATESTVLGPFYVAGSPEREYGASIVERPSGEPAWVTGCVTDVDGIPIAGATLDVWQNADDMLYAVQNPHAPEGNLRGKFRTGADGSFAFLGVRPTDYPIPDDGPVGRSLAATGRHPWRPAHLHVIVSAPGYQTVATHIFDSQSRYLDSDAVFAVKSSLVRDFTRHERASGDAVPDAIPDPVPDGVPPGTVWYSLQHDFLLTTAPA